MSKKALTILTSTVLLLTILATLNQASAAQTTPQFTISKSSGCVGDIVTVSGSSFAGHSKLTIDTFLYETTTDKSGAFSGQVTIPGDGYLAAGTYDVVAKDSKGNEAHASFTMLPSIVLTPDYGPAGSVIHIHGDCLVPGGKTYTMDILLDDKLLVTTEEFPLGVLDIDITIPTETSLGEHTITAKPNGGDFASAIFTVKKGEAVTFTITDLSNGNSHVNGYVGDKLTFSGSGYSPDKTVQIIYASSTLAKATVDKEGKFTVDYQLPEMAGGVYDIYATDDTNTAHSVFTILPSIVLTPTLGAPKTIVTMVGNGFSPDAVGDKLSAKFNGETIPLEHLGSDGSEGNFVASFTVPDALPGPYIFTVTCVADPTIHASTTFNVSSLAVTPENPFGALLAVFACVGAVMIFKKRGHKK